MVYSSGSSTEFSILNLCRSTLYLMIPLACWLADTKIGRGTAVYLSLWFGWLGVLFECISACFQYSSCGILESIGKYGISSLALLLMAIATSLFLANGVAYGLDQLISASHVKLRALIHWYVWALFISGNPIFVVEFLSPANEHIGNLIIILSTLLLFSLSLCLHFMFQNRFEDLAIRNPYRTVYDVLKFTWHHKHPLKRSSMTYWENNLPHRIDFAKSKFGGPFSHEAVEDVKTFLRILVMILVIAPLFASSDPVVNGLISFVPQFKGGDTEFGGFAPFLLWFIGDNHALWVIPLLELLILPLFPKIEYFLISPLKGLGVAMICNILSIFFVFLFDLIGRIVAGETVYIPCYYSWSSNDPSLPLPFWVLLIPGVLAGIVDLLSLIYAFEFLCSQSPHHMKGLLIGLFWFVREMAVDVGSLISLPFQLISFSGPWKLSCTSWITLILLIMAVAGLCLYVAMSRWYVKRVRDDELDLRAAVEQHFEHQLKWKNKHRIPHNRNVIETCVDNDTEDFP